jgi:signal peptidase I
MLAQYQEVLKGALMLESPRAPNGVGCQLISDVLRSFGSVKVRVTGSSMLPCVLPGDILAVQRKELHEVGPGDIVLFVRENRLIAHRVVNRIRQGSVCLVTCGDSMDQNDPPVFAHELLGRVTFIDRWGLRVDPRATFFGRLVSIVFRRSQFLTRSLVWIVNRTRLLREEVECRA